MSRSIVKACLVFTIVLASSSAGYAQRRAVEGDQFVLVARLSRSVKELYVGPKDLVAVTEDRGGTVTLVNVGARRVARKIRLTDRSVHDVSFQPGGRALVTVSSRVGAKGGNEVAVWNTADGVEKFKLPVRARYVHTVAFAPSGRMIATGGGREPLANFGLPVHSGAPGDLVVWGVNLGKRLQRYRGVPGVVHKLAFSPDGNWLGVISNPEPGANNFRKHFMLLPCAGQMADPVNVDADALMYFLSFSGDSRFVAVSGSDIVDPMGSLVKVWSIAEGKWVAAITGEPAQAFDAVLSADGKYVITVNRDGLLLSKGRGEIAVYDVASGEKKFTAATQYNSPVISKNDLLAYSPERNRLQILDLATLKPIFNDKRNSAATLVAMSFSDSGDELISLWNDGVVFSCTPEQEE